jgi:virginiamycin B lyase
MVAALLLLTIALRLGMAAESEPAATHSITEFIPPTSASHPSAITTGPDGALWFAESAGKIGRITLDGKITEFPIKGSGVLHSITIGPDGAVWFTEFTSKKIGRIPATATAEDLSLSEFAVAGSAGPLGITTGPDGALWFAEPVSGKIERITTDGKVSEFALPNPYAEPWGITTGPDGALWFTEASCVRQPGPHCNVGNKIGRITTAGLITEFPVPSDGSGPHSITTGPDGALWFTEYYGNRVGRLALP